MSYPSTRLDKHHATASFDCGIDTLNTWLNADAMKAQKANTARTYVWTETPEKHEVLAYFSTAPTAVFRHDLNSGQAGGQSGLIPAYLLARLALDVRLHGQKLGTELLIDAIGRMAGAYETMAGRLVVADAVDERAYDFYLKHGFVPVQNTPMRVVAKMASIRKLLGINDD